MAFDAHVNFAYATVATAPSPAASGTSLTLSAGAGAGFPAVPFNATVWPTGVIALATNAEIIRVTARAGDVLTIARAAEPPSGARAIVVGDQIAATITAKTLTDAEGPVADTRLSANVALLNAANVFIQNQQIARVRPTVELKAPLDTGKVRVFADDPGRRLYLSTNLSFNGSSWVRDDITAPAALVGLANEQLSLSNAPAGANPATLTVRFLVDDQGNVSFTGTLSAAGGINASQLATGTVPDARLSANVALEGIANVFTQPQTLLNTALRFSDSGAPVDQRLFNILDLGGQLYFQSYTDALAAIATPLTLSRNGDVAIGGSLIGGSVPDARLSANIPRLDAATNVFLGWQEVRSVGGTQGRFMWRDTTMPANQQLWEMALSGGLMYVLPLTDSGVTTGAPGPLVLSPTGDVLVGRDLTEKGRTTPLGHWTSAALGSYLTGFTGSYSYSYIGKTMLLTVFGSATLGASVASLSLLFPSGVTAAFACIPVIAGAVGSGWSGGVAYVAGPGATSCDLYLVQNAPWPAGAVQVALSISIPIQ